MYIFKSLCASRDDYFENLGETNALACEMFTSGCRPWLKNVACLSSLFHILNCGFETAMIIAYLVGNTIVQKI